jgi:hypothetical protein
MARPIAPLETLLTVVNLALLTGLLVIFLQQWRRTRSKFSLGLVLFAGVFLVKELLDVLKFIGRAADLPILGPRIELIVTLAEAVALAILLYIVAR